MERPAPSDRLELDLACTIDAVEQARERLITFLMPYGLDDRVIMRLEVVLEELVSNIARHSAQAKTIRILAAMQGADIALQIADDGEAFDPLSTDDPDSFTSLQEARLGGLGVPLIKKLTSQLGYARTGGWNAIDLVLAGQP